MSLRSRGGVSRRLCWSLLCVLPGWLGANAGDEERGSGWNTNEPTSCRIMGVRTPAIVGAPLPLAVEFKGMLAYGISDEGVSESTRLALLDATGKAVAFRRPPRPLPHKAKPGEIPPRLSPPDLENTVPKGGLTFGVPVQLCLDLAQVFKIEAPGVYTVVISGRSSGKELARHALTVWSLKWRWKLGTEPDSLSDKRPPTRPGTQDGFELRYDKIAQEFIGDVVVMPRAVLDWYGVKTLELSGIVQLARASNGREERELLVARLYPVSSHDNSDKLVQQLPILGYAVVPEGVRLGKDPVLDQHGQLYASLYEEGKGPLTVIFDLWTGQAAFLPGANARHSFVLPGIHSRCIVESYKYAEEGASQRIWSGFHGRWPGFPDEWRELVEGPGRTAAPEPAAK